MSNEPTWQTMTTLRSKDGSTEFKVVGTERERADKEPVVQVCAFWSRAGGDDQTTHSSSQILGSYFTRDGAMSFIENHLAGQRGAVQLMVDCELNKATFCALCQVEMGGGSFKNILMRSPIEVSDGIDTFILKGDLLVLCDGCYSTMKTIQSNA